MASKTKKVPVEIGVTGLVGATGGRVGEELHPHLTGRKALETWRSMESNDPMVGAILFAIDMLVRQVEWRVEQGDSKQADATFLEECMEDMSHSFGDFVSEVLSMLPYGFSFHEINYKLRNGPKLDDVVPGSRFSDGKVGWRSLPGRSQDTLDRWVFDEKQGTAQAFVQVAAPDYTERVIPFEKGLLFRWSVRKNNPEGKSLLRTSYESWFYKKRIQQIEGTGIERDLAGFPVFWLPAEYLGDDADPEAKKVVQSFRNLGENIKRDKQEYLIMPLAYDEAGNKAYDFTLMNSGGARTFDTNAIIARYNQMIAMTMLADFILLGHEKVGSFALSDNKTNLFAMALGTILDSIQDVLNRYAVPRLFALNGHSLEDLPKIMHGDIEDPDLTMISQFISTIASTGVPMFPDPDLEAWLRKIARLPEKSKEAEKLQEEEEANKADQYQPRRAQDDEEEPAPEGGDNGPGQGGGTGPQEWQWQ